MTQLDLPDVIYLPGPIYEPPPSAEADYRPARKARRGSETRKKTTCVTSRYDDSELAELIGTETWRMAGILASMRQRGIVGKIPYATTEKWFLMSRLAQPPTPL
jgi:hypothetical protein